MRPSSDRPDRRQFLRESARFSGALAVASVSGFLAGRSQYWFQGRDWLKGM